MSSPKPKTARERCVAIPEGKMKKLEAYWEAYWAARLGCVAMIF